MRSAAYAPVRRASEEKRIVGEEGPQAVLLIFAKALDSYAGRPSPAYLLMSAQTSSALRYRLMSRLRPSSVKAEQSRQSDSSFAQRGRSLSSPAVKRLCSLTSPSRSYPPFAEARRSTLPCHPVALSSVSQARLDALAGSAAQICRLARPSFMSLRSTLTGSQDAVKRPTTFGRKGRPPNFRLSVIIPLSAAYRDTAARTVHALAA